MAKRFDYYAGYPGQQKTPKWVGVTLGSLFGALTVFMFALGIRLVMPPRKAEASVAPKPELNAPVVAEAARPVADAPVVAQKDAPSSQLAVQRFSSKGHHGSKKAMKGGKGHGKVALFAKAPAPKETAKYKKAQMYAKSVSSNRRDKKARDELDKMLGL